jgi:hypothetical protein
MGGTDWGGRPRDRLHCATRRGAKWMEALGRRRREERGGGGRRTRPDARRRVWRGGLGLGRDGTRQEAGKSTLAWFGVYAEAASQSWAGPGRVFFLNTNLERLVKQLDVWNSTSSKTICNSPRSIGVFRYQEKHVAAPMEIVMVFVWYP